MLLLHKKLNNFKHSSILIACDLNVIFLRKTYFIFNYYLLNELLWQEALIIDFLQKKIITNWVQKFLIISSYLFNERLVFESLIKFFLDLFLLPFHKLFIFQINNISNLFNSIFFLWCVSVVVFIFIHSFILLF